jgi:hypothetical protein
MRTMTRFKYLFAAALAYAIVAVAPAADAQTFHFVGAGSSAQYTMSAIAADQAALNMNASVYGGAETIAHWDFNNGAQAADNRDSLNRILPELGNIWIVWLTNSGGTITDVWTDLSVDSTVGVRTFSAVQPNGVQGAYLQIVEPADTAGQNKIGTCSGTTDLLWPDNQCDTNLPASLLADFGGQASQGVAGQNIGPQINVGLTDIRPEDAYAATTRSIGALNTTTWATLGYVGPTASIGAPIYTAQGTGTVATPIKFGLAGKADPIQTHFTVNSYTTIPVGAAPIVFIYNNAGDASYPIDLVSGVTPDNHETGQTYPLADLFDGKTACTNLNPAFDAYTGSTPASRNITLFLREPLSGTMNTTEYSLFRTDGQDATGLYNSQEVGLTNPTRAPDNPLNLACASGGSRERAIGTGEVVGKLATSGGYGVLNTPGSLGYIFWGFSNALKFYASGVTPTNYNYLTLDGIDPLGLPASLTGNGNQNLPNCTTTTCPASLWAGSDTFPNLRNGSYKAWSIYRWVTLPNSDVYGPSAVAQLAQDYVDSDIADFVPFSACPTNDPSCSGSSPTDGLSVYHSHFTQSGITGTNGTVTTANTFNGGNTLGGGTEKGGDEGGYIEGPFGVTAPYFGYVEWFTTTKVLDGATVAEVSFKKGSEFAAGASWVGCTITLGNPNSSTSAQTIQGCPVKGVNKCNPTATVLYVGAANPASIETIPVPYTVSCGGTVQQKTYPKVTGAGVLNLHQ